MNAWFAHTFDESRLNETVAGPGGKEEKYYVAWAREHMALAAAMTSGGEVGNVQYTWLRVLPVSLRDLLPKGLEDYKTVAALCKDIMCLESDRVAFRTRDVGPTTADAMASLARRMANLEFGGQRWAQQARPPTPGRTTQPPRAAVHFPDSLTAAPRPTANAVPNQTPTRQGNALRATSPAPASSLGPAPALAPAFSPRPSTASARGITFDDTPAGRESHAANVASLPEQVTTQTAYPLTPGTLKQTERTCPRCGRGEHTAFVCKSDPLPDKEIKWREETRKDLLRQKLGLRSPRTPAPSSRLDMYQVLMENGLEDDFDDYYEEVGMEEQGNGSGQWQ